MKQNKEGGKKIILGLPKGSLQESTFSMFEKAGFKIRSTERSYFPSIDDPEIEIILLRAQEIPMYVEDGVLDMGITGFDWIKETGANVVDVAELIYAKQGLRPVKWVLAVPDNSPIKSVKDLKGKRIATEVVNLATEYLKKHGVTAKIEFSWGATEAKTPRLVDAIIEITETGSSLKAHNLRIIDTVLHSTTRFIANKEAWKDPWKKKKAEELLMLLKGVLVAETKVGLMMNVRKKDLKNVIGVLPSLQNPTVTELSNKEWCDVITIVDKKSIKVLIPLLKAKGAAGIVEFPLNKIID